MNFLWHLRGSVRLRSTASDEVSLEALEELLEKQRKSPERGSASIIFESPLCSDFFGGGRAMDIYDRGRFWIEQGPTTCVAYTPWSSAYLGR